MFNLPNPNKFNLFLKEYLEKLLNKEKLENHAEVIEKISYQMHTDRDFKLFMQLLIEIYESGYVRAINDYRSEFEKYGIKVNINYLPR